MKSLGGSRPGSRRHRHTSRRRSGDGPGAFGLPGGEQAGGVLRLHVDVLRSGEGLIKRQSQIQREIVSGPGD